MIGLGPRAEVRAAGKTMLEVATGVQSHASVTKSTPLPAAGSVNFYLLTAKGVLRYLAPEKLLGEGKDPMSKLFYSGQNVITQIRIVDGERDAKARAPK